jgi:hypothetical protein
MKPLPNSSRAQTTQTPSRLKQSITAGTAQLVPVLPSSRCAEPKLKPRRPRRPDLCLCSVTPSCRATAVPHPAHRFTHEPSCRSSMPPPFTKATSLL